MKVKINQEVEKKEHSAFMKFLYGKDCELNTCINFSDEANGRSSRLGMRIFSALIVLTSIVMACLLFELRSLMTFMTNWAMLLSFFYIVLTIVFSSIPDIQSQHGKLVGLHILYEFAFATNIITVFFYWGIIHAVAIDQFEGWKKVHMYTVHILPALGLWLT